MEDNHKIRDKTKATQYGLCALEAVFRTQPQNPGSTYSIPLDLKFLICDQLDVGKKRIALGLCALPVVCGRLSENPKSIYAIRLNLKVIIYQTG